MGSRKRQWLIIGVIVVLVVSVYLMVFVSGANSREAEARGSAQRELSLLLTNKENSLQKSESDCVTVNYPAFEWFFRIRQCSWTETSYVSASDLVTARETINRSLTSDGWMVHQSVFTDELGFTKDPGDYTYEVIDASRNSYNVQNAQQTAVASVFTATIYDRESFRENVQSLTSEEIEQVLSGAQADDNVIIEMRVGVQYEG